MYFLYLFLFYLVFLPIAIFGAYRLWLLLLYRDSEKIKLQEKEIKEYPFVTIQIPIYNEVNVVERIIESASNIQYPKEKFEIQILDDSTDETKELVDRLVEIKKREGFNIYTIRRKNRKGFKAGALKNGIKYAKGEFLAIFDADFIIPPDFLKRTIPYFEDPKVAFVQAKWDYINEYENLLTRIQAMILRNHFWLEQEAKFKNGFFFNFNGTAGIWRKSAIIEAGNWNEDTLAEDLDLSIRSYLKGFKGIFLDDLLVPSELPTDFNAFLTQQKRWTKGTFQVGLKLWKSIMKSNLDKEDKLNILIHTLSPFLYLLNVIYFLIIWPLSKYSHIIFGLLVLFLSMVHLFNIWVIDKKVRENYLSEWRLKEILYLVIVFTSFCFEGAKAVLEAIFKKDFTFERTPKKGRVSKKNYSAGNKNSLSEILKILYSLFSIFLAFKLKIWGAIPWLFLFSLSSIYYFVKNINILNTNISSIEKSVLTKR